MRKWENVGETVFQGANQINLDAKGRMAVPTRAREPLTQGGTVKLVLTAHPDACLLLYPGPAWEPIRTKVMSFPSLDRQASLWKRLLVGFAQEVEPDSAGRLLIPPELREFAHIERQVMLVGQGSHFEIWDLETWNTQLEALRSGGSPTLPPGMENFSL
ncbi:MAG TPA: division/cell wall cluster transcriptional repressor MraZ [Usitatibacter sp.]|nr:division/cell wall cluster transcriptional repressor MraZ [Usitatibacter sp.]